MKPVGGMCDRCGQRYRLQDLKTEYKKGRPNNLLVCPSCWDDEHEQEPIRWPTPNDKESINDPRPEIGRDAERSMPAWNPVGNPAVFLRASGGKAYVN